jgi:5-methyltetrahydropteroyltriglutamate--homocysteine methyltransferase
VRWVHGAARVPPQHLGDRGQVEGRLEEPDVRRAPQVAGRAFGHHRDHSDWISSGTYDAISKQLFRRATNYHVFLLEYDDERSGSFSALGDVPDDKAVVLGLVSTKFDRMEPADQLAERIREASGFFPLEQLALSTQCGFASAGPGNAISEGAQENKLRLVAEVANRVWRDG